MKERPGAPSLLPYLHPEEAGIRLKIPLASGDVESLRKLSFPFLVLNDSDPFTRLIRAKFETGTGSSVREIFLLLPKETCPVQKSELTPISNRDVESFWQKAFEAYSKKNDGSFIVLPEQVGGDGEFIPFQPLFFCKQREVFFHPPCPECGQALQQCQNDRILKTFDLPSYSGSLNRYLFCPSCLTASNKANFYAYEVGDSDRATAKDRFELISEFGNLVAKVKSSGLPCVLCERSNLCYMEERLAQSTVVPFLFYPSFIFFFEAMSLRAVDFLKAVSGATSEQITAYLKEKGEYGTARQVSLSELSSHEKTGFFFRAENRLFLEVLFLKLTLFGQLIRQILPEDGSSRPLNPSPDIDATWVKLTDRSGLLPYFWNFESRVMDIFKPPFDIPDYPGIPAAYTVHSLGVLWFHVLLVNARQNASAVNRAIERSLDNIAGLPSTGPFAADESFAPAQVFWEAEGREMKKEWQAFWQECLDLGWSLLRAAREGEIAWSAADFLERVKEARQRIGKELFSTRAGGGAVRAEPEKTTSGTEDAMIYGILTRLIAKWAAEKSIEPAADGFESDSGMPAETVILPGGRKVDSPRWEPDTRDEALAETVIMSAAKPEASKVEPEAQKQTESLSETVIISKKDLHAGASPPDRAAHLRQQGPEEDMLETVVLSPARGRVPSSGVDPAQPRTREAGETPGSARGSKPVEDELAETLILSGPKTSPPESPGLRPEERDSCLRENDCGKTDKRDIGKGKPVPEDDFVTETVILGPKPAMDPGRKESDD